MIVNESEMAIIAQKFVQVLPELMNAKAPLLIYLEGNLGAGKTSFVREILRSLGHKGVVKSPTYTLVEPYLVDMHIKTLEKTVFPVDNLKKINLYHFDLYRLLDPYELYDMGIDGYFSKNSLSFIEWPNKGLDVLPPANIQITIAHAQEKRDITFQSSDTKLDSILAPLGCN